MPRTAGRSLGSLAVVATLLIAVGCADRGPVVLSCRQPSSSVKPPVTWVLRLDTSANTAEMIVAVPSDAAAVGAPSGNRPGKLRATERQYEIQIPFDEGGAGKDKWIRLAFTFEIDRYTGAGKAYVGGKTAEAEPSLIQCDAVADTPRR